MRCVRTHKALDLHCSPQHSPPHSLLFCLHFSPRFSLFFNLIQRHKMVAARRKNAGISLHHFVKTVRDRAPGLEEMNNSLNELQVRHEKSAGKKVKIILNEKAKVSTGVFYLLPEALVNRAVGQVYAQTMTNPEAPYDVTDSQAGSQAVSQDCDQSGKPYPEECVHVPGVGDFTSKQLCAMQDAWVTKKSVVEGLCMARWLEESFPSQVLERINAKDFEKWSQPVAAKLCACFLRDNRPHTRLPGFHFDMFLQHVYRMMPGRWFNCDGIRAVGEIISRRTQGRCVMTMLPEHMTKEPDVIIVHDKLVAFLREKVADDTCDMIFMPVNVDKSHWALVMIDKIAEENKGVMIYYDSFDKRKVKTLLHKICAKLLVDCSLNYQLVQQGSPLQKDYYSCGLFVLHYCWKKAELEMPNGYATKAMVEFRLLLVKYVLFSTSGMI